MTRSSFDRVRTRRPFGFFSQHKKRCALCLDWFCDACVMQRVPLHLVNKVERALSPTDVPMLNTCEECTRIAYAYVRCAPILRPSFFDGAVMDL
jgi:hypothetical protein